MCDYEDDHCEMTGVAGVTRLALDDILALGADATPMLLRLASSTNPVARLAATIGLGHVQSQVGRSALQRLAIDTTSVPRPFGEPRRLADAAADSLRKYR